MKDFLIPEMEFRVWNEIMQATGTERSIDLQIYLSHAATH